MSKKVNIKGVVLSHKALDLIESLQEEDNQLANYHIANLADAIGFILEMVDYVDRKQEKQLLLHAAQLSYIRSNFKLLRR